MATYHITCDTDLQNIENDLAGDYILDHDIDMSHLSNWIPIGLSEGFTGTFDGQNYTISNLTITDTDGSYWACGIFAYLEYPAFIKNVKVENLSISSTSSGGGNVGGIAGLVNGYDLPETDRVRIYNCHVYGTISSDGQYTGGIVGYTNLGSLYKCHSELEMTWNDPGDTMGSIIGRSDYTNSTDCYSEGTITVATGAEGWVIGGFIGEMGPSNTVKNCYANVEIFGGDSSGGFIGLQWNNVDDNIVKNCFSVGVVHDLKPSPYCAGFVGETFGKKTQTPQITGFTNCAWLTTSAVCALGTYEGWSMWATLEPYAIGKKVKHPDINDLNIYWISLQNLNSGNDPATSPTWWAEEDLSGNLEDVSWGTDESDYTKLQQKTHDVYDQGNADAWDFDSGNVWFERYDCGEYPAFEGCVDTSIYDDCGEVGIATTNFASLSHLEGMTVSILANGEVLDQQVVTDGTVSLPSNYSKITVGLPFESDLETLNVEIPTKEGTLQGKKIKIGCVTFRMVESIGGWVGPDEDNLYEAFTEEIQGTSLYSGDIRIPLGAGYEDGGRILYRQIDPLPITVTAVIPELVPGGPAG